MKAMGRWRASTRVEVRVTVVWRRTRRSQEDVGRQTDGSIIQVREKSGVKKEVSGHIPQILRKRNPQDWGDDGVGNV